MSRIEIMRQELAKIHMTLKTSPERVEDIVMEVLEAGRSVGLNPEKRAEGYALAPSSRAAALGLPHLRIAVMEDVLTVWVRAPYSLDEERSWSAGMSAEKLHDMIVAGAMKIAEVLRKHSESEELLQISLP